MIRTALDSDDLSAFTANVDFILTYTDLIADARAFEAAHPLQTVRYIDRGLGDPGDKSTIIDIERGARTPADLPAWYDDKESKGFQFLTMYVNRSNIAAANAALAGRSISHWVATLDGTVHVDGYEPLLWPALVQTTGAAALGIHADFSLVLSPGWNPSSNLMTINRAVAGINAAIIDSQHTAAELTAVIGELRSLR